MGVAGGSWLLVLVGFGRGSLMPVFRGASTLRRLRVARAYRRLPESCLGFRAIAEMSSRRSSVKASGTARSVLRDAVNEQLTPARVRQLIDEAFGASSVSVVVCEKCGTAVKAPVPDVKKAVDSITALIQEAEGRPEQRRVEAARVTIVRPPL